MFSSGQILFALIFIVVFIGVLLFSYAKDKKLHDRNYKGVKWVGFVFTTFIIILFVIKYLLKN